MKSLCPSTRTLPPVRSCRGSGDLPRPTTLREGPSAVSLAPRARYLSTPGRGLCAEVAFACGRRACFAKSPESVTLVEFGSPPRRLGLAPVRRASAPGGFIRDSRRGWTRGRREDWLPSAGTRLYVRSGHPNATRDAMRTLTGIRDGWRFEAGAKNPAFIPDFATLSLILGMSMIGI